MRFIAFGSKWHADEVFADKIPELFASCSNQRHSKLCSDMKRIR